MNANDRTTDNQPEEVISTSLLPSDLLGMIERDGWPHGPVAVDTETS